MNLVSHPFHCSNLVGCCHRLQKKTSLMLLYVHVHFLHFSLRTRCVDAVDARSDQVLPFPEEHLLLLGFQLKHQNLYLYLYTFLSRYLLSDVVHHPKPTNPRSHHYFAREFLFDRGDLEGHRFGDPLYLGTGCNGCCEIFSFRVQSGRGMIPRFPLYT